MALSNLASDSTQPYLLYSILIVKAVTKAYPGLRERDRDFVS